MIMTNTYKEHLKERPLRLLTFGTFAHSDEKTWPKKQKGDDKDKDNDNDKWI